jgi:hypothetical protein
MESWIFVYREILSYAFMGMVWEARGQTENDEAVWK